MNEEYFTFHPQYKHSGTFANRKCEEKTKKTKKKHVRDLSGNKPRIPGIPK